MTDQEYADRYGLSLERVQALRQELKQNTPRAQKAKREVAEAFRQAAAENFSDTATERLRSIFAPPPRIKPETVRSLCWDIKLMRRAKEWGG